MSGAMVLGRARRLGGSLGQGPEGAPRPHRLDQARRILGALIQCWGSVATTGDGMAGRYDAPSGFDTPPEVGGIDPASQNHLVDVAKLGHSEVARQELEGDQRLLHLVAQALKREAEDLVVVEG